MNKTAHQVTSDLRLKYNALILLTGLVSHAILLWLKMAISGGLNLALGLMFSLIMLFVVMVYFLFSIWRKQLSSLGLSILPITLLALICGQFFPGEALMFNSLYETLRWHVLFAIPAFIFMCLAFAQAILLIIGENHMRKPNKTSLFMNLPAIDSMDKVLYSLILISFILITLNICLGFFTVYSNSTLSLNIDHHFIFTILSWLSLFCLIIGRAYLGWRNSVSSKWTISAFMFLLLAYFGTRFVIQVFLQ